MAVLPVLNVVWDHVEEVPVVERTRAVQVVLLRGQIIPLKRGDIDEVEGKDDSPLGNEQVDHHL